MEMRMLAGVGPRQPSQVSPAMSEHRMIQPGYAYGQQQQMMYHHQSPVPSGYPAYALPGNAMDNPSHRFPYPKSSTSQPLHGYEQHQSAFQQHLIPQQSPLENSMSYNAYANKSPSDPNGNVRYVQQQQQHIYNQQCYQGGNMPIDPKCSSYPNQTYVSNSHQGGFPTQSYGNVYHRPPHPMPGHVPGSFQTVGPTSQPYRQNAMPVNAVGQHYQQQVYFQQGQYGVPTQQQFQPHMQEQAPSMRGFAPYPTRQLQPAQQMAPRESISRHPSQHSGVQYAPPGNAALGYPMTFHQPGFRATASMGQQQHAGTHGPSRYSHQQVYRNPCPQSFQHISHPVEVATYPNQQLNEMQNAGSSSQVLCQQQQQLQQQQRQGYMMPQPPMTNSDSLAMQHQPQLHEHPPVVTTSTSNEVSPAVVVTAQEMMSAPMDSTVNQSQPSQSNDFSLLTTQTESTLVLQSKDVAAARIELTPSAEVITSKIFVDKVQVPWGWRRLVLSESVIYYSPSGIQLKSKEEVKNYLLKDGTCKCGLECPLDIDSSFDFDDAKQSEMMPFPMQNAQVSRHCTHKKAISALATNDKTLGFMSKINHIHNPILDSKKGGKRRSRKKQKPFSGLKVVQMLQARDSERQRINEIIYQQKQQYEAQHTASSPAVVIQAIPSSAVLTSASQSTAAGNEKLLPHSAQPVSMSHWQQPGNQIANVASKELEESGSGDLENKLKAKNLEIRRMSSTDDGDKILSDAWDSPEKDKGKTPLEMVENIVSNIEMVASAPEPKSGTSSPALGVGPNGKGKKINRLLPIMPQVPSQTAPQTHSPPHLWTQTGKPLLHSQQQHQQLMNEAMISKPQVVTTSTFIHAPQGFTPPSAIAHMQPVMQLVNTINGPMLMQAVAVNNHSGLIQIPATVAMNQPSIVAGPSNATFVRNEPTLKKLGKKKRGAAAIKQTRSNPIPILMSPAVRTVQSQQLSSQPGPNGQHILTLNQQNTRPSLMTAQTTQGIPQLMSQPNIILNHAGQVVTNQMILSNGTILTMPAMQTGMIFNQLPDGTFYQVQNHGMLAAPMPMIQSGQSIIASGQFSGPILVNGGGTNSSTGGQFANGGTFFMTPQGLVQAISQQSPVQTVTVSEMSMATRPPVPVPDAVAATATVTTSSQSIPVSSAARASHAKMSNQESQTSNKFQQSQSSTKEDDDNDDTDDDSDDSDEDDEEEEEEEDDDDDEDEEIEEVKVAEDDEEVQEVIARPRSSRSSLRSRRSTPEASSKTSPKTFLQSNRVDSSGLKATPPHSGDFESSSSANHHHSGKLDLVSTSMNDSLDTSGASASTEDSKASSSSGQRRRRKRNAEEILQEELLVHSDEESDESPQSSEVKHFSIGEIVWGPHGSFPSWPGKLVESSERDSSNSSSSDDIVLQVCWFGSKEVTDVESYKLKSLSDGLEAHHRERKRLRKGRKMNAGLERAIQEAMAELDRIN